MNTSILLSLTASLAFLAACSGQPAAQTAEKTLPASQPVAAGSAKTYRVATDATYPPFEFRDEANQFTGMEIDLLNAIAADQGFRLDYYHHEWDGIFEQLTEKKADIIAAAVTIDEESQAKADLSQSYFRSPYRVVSIKPEYVKDFQWTRQKIAVTLNDDTESDLIERYGIKAEQFHRESTPYLALTSLVKGEADVVAGDATVLQFYMNSQFFKENHYEFASEILPSKTPESANLVFAVQKGNRELLGQINSGLENLKRNGEFDKIMAKWRQE